MLTTGLRKSVLSSKTDSTGKFCVFLPLGEYIIKVWLFNVHVCVNYPCIDNKNTKM